MLRPLLAAAFALTLAACGQSQQAQPTKGVLNLYTARHYDADLQLYDAFTKATGIKVNRLEMEPDQLIERMKAEGDASPADVILMADAGALWRAQEAGLFQKVTTPTLEARIPQNVRGPEGYWWGFSRRARVIAYDKTKVRPDEVATYEQLASPRFKGQVCVRNSDNVYNLSLMASFIERWGRPKALAWAKGVVANMARTPQGGDIDQIRAVGAGACQVALTNTYYFLRIAAHAPHRDAAVQFLNFLASDQAQGIFAGANHEYPAVPGVKPPADVEAWSHFKADPMPVAIYGQRQAEAQQVYDEAGWR